MKKTYFFIPSCSFLIAFLVMTLVTIAYAQPINERQDVQTFINKMVKEHGFDPAELNQLFSNVEIRQSTVNSMNRPAEATPWHSYKELFVTPTRTANGVAFWQENQTTLNKAASEYGVPPEIIVAIIGIETNYGRTKGNHRVIDALSTLAFEYPRRAEYFTRELEQFLLLTRENNIDPLTVHGSYAGAMGKPQFMPSSYRAYAVDYTDSGNIDLVNNVDDAIGSVANYFKVHGWQSGEPIAVPAQVSGQQYKSLNTKQRKATTVISQLTQYGIQPAAEVSNDPKANLIELEGKNNKEYWLGFTNFYVITRYNASNLYAMAVYQLAEEIAQQKQATA